MIHSKPVPIDFLQEPSGEISLNNLGSHSLFKLRAVEYLANKILDHRRKIAWLAIALAVATVAAAAFSLIPLAIPLGISACLLMAAAAWAFRIREDNASLLLGSVNENMKRMSKVIQEFKTREQGNLGTLQSLRSQLNREPSGLEADSKEPES